MVIGEVREGYRFERNEIEFYEKLRDGYDPSRVYHNPHMRGKLDEIIDGDKSGFGFGLGQYIFVLFNWCKIAGVLDTMHQVGRAGEEWCDGLERVGERRGI